jgi:hypothetical protein
MKFQKCVWKPYHIYMLVLQLFTEFIVLPPNVVRMKYWDFEEPMKSSGHFALWDLRHFYNVHYFSLLWHRIIELCHDLLH